MENPYRASNESRKPAHRTTQCCSSNKCRTTLGLLPIHCTLRGTILLPASQKVAHHPLATCDCSILVVRSLFLDFRQCRIPTFIVTLIPRRTRAGGSDTGNTQPFRFATNSIRLVGAKILRVE